MLLGQIRYSTVPVTQHGVSTNGLTPLSLAITLSVEEKPDYIGELTMLDILDGRFWVTMVADTHPARKGPTTVRS